MTFASSPTATFSSRTGSRTCCASTAPSRKITPSTYSLGKTSVSAMRTLCDQAMAHPFLCRSVEHFAEGQSRFTAMRSSRTARRTPSSATKSSNRWRRNAGQGLREDQPNEYYALAALVRQVLVRAMDEQGTRFAEEKDRTHLAEAPSPDSGWGSYGQVGGDSCSGSQSGSSGSPFCRRSCWRCSGADVHPRQLFVHRQQCPRQLGT